jgi:hypothetical protein
VCRRFAQDDSSSSDRSPTRSRRVTALNPIRESTPVEDSGAVSSLLSRFGITSRPSTDNSGALISSPSKSIREMIPTPSDMLSVVKKREEIVLQRGNDMLLTLRVFLSNSRNIWSLTALFELLFILYAIIPWALVDVSPPYLVCDEEVDIAPTGTPFTYGVFKELFSCRPVSTSSCFPTEGFLENPWPLGCPRSLHPCPFWHPHLFQSGSTTWSIRP